MKKAYTKESVKNELSKTAGISFKADVHSLSLSQLCELSETAKKVGYRPGKNRNYSIGVAFFLYLNRK